MPEATRAADFRSRKKNLPAGNFFRPDMSLYQIIFLHSESVTGYLAVFRDAAAPFCCGGRRILAGATQAEIVYAWCLRLNFFGHRGVASAAHVRKYAMFKLRACGPAKTIPIASARAIAGDITLKTFEEIDFPASLRKDVAGARVCANGDGNIFLISSSVAEPSQDFDGPPDYTKNCRTTDFTF